MANKKVLSELNRWFRNNLGDIQHRINSRVLRHQGHLMILSTRTKDEAIKHKPTRNSKGDFKCFIRHFIKNNPALPNWKRKELVTLYATL